MYIYNNQKKIKKKKFFLNIYIKRCKKNNIHIYILKNITIGMEFVKITFIK